MFAGSTVLEAGYLTNFTDDISSNQYLNEYMNLQLEVAKILSSFSTSSNDMNQWSEQESMDKLEQIKMTVQFESDLANVIKFNY